MSMKYDERMAICEACPLLKEDPTWGPVCNSALFLNVQTNETSRLSHDGWIRGCGCHLKIKCRQPNAKCIAGKWD